MSIVDDYIAIKKVGKKIAMITCYDFTSAQIVAKTNVDCILIGDSSSMLMHGATNTTQSTIEQIVTHTQAVARAVKDKLIIADLPFMSYHKSKTQTLEAVEKLVRVGAQAIKLEGATSDVLQTVKSIIDVGIPVMGHLGLTPQHIHQFGGFKMQGRSLQQATLFIEQAQQLEAAGCFSIVLECIPATLAEKITQSVNVPTIGIGAGSGTDGQVLVFHDLLGLQDEFKPKFVKRYLNGSELFTKSINQYVGEVRQCEFPNEETSY